MRAGDARLGLWCSGVLWVYNWAGASVGLSKDMCVGLFVGVVVGAAAWTVLKYRMA